MREGDAAFDALRAAIEAVAGEDAADLVAEARAEARAKVRSILADAMADAMLERAGTALAPPAPAPRRTESRPATAELGWYVFGVVRAGAVEAPEETQLIREGDLAAVARRVGLDEYGEEALRENLNDIAWLEEAARRHEAVLDELLRATTVIPLRLCTIYRGEDAVRAMLAGEHDELGEALERLAGRAEWGVKAFYAAPETPDGEADGADYLLRKRDAGRATEEARAAVSAAHARLSALAEEALANPLQR